MSIWVLLLAYPGLPWLMKPYPNRNLSQSQERFNNTLSKARVVAERAYGILKPRWRCLLKELEIQTRNVPKTVFACCTLHNIFIMRGEAIPELEENDDNDDNDEDDDENPDGDNNTANDVREAIRCHLDNM